MGDWNAAGPPPTRVGQLPQAVTTVSGTVAAPWPPVARRTLKLYCDVLGAAVTTAFPVLPISGPASISAFVALPNWSP